MRCSNRNYQRIYYAKYTGVTTTTDEWGNENGQEITYSEPISMNCNISAAKNAEFADIFGMNVDYDRVLIIPSRTFELDEYSVVWVDADPANDDPYDYVVRRVSRSLNATAVAIKRVDVQ